MSETRSLDGGWRKASQSNPSGNCVQIKLILGGFSTMHGTSGDDAVSWIRPDGAGDGVSWSKHRTGSLVNAAGERKASASGSHPYGNCVVVLEVNPRA